MINYTYQVIYLLSLIFNSLKFQKKNIPQISKQLITIANDNNSASNKNSDHKETTS